MRVPVVTPVGAALLALFEFAGKLAIFTAQGVRHSVMPPFYPRLILSQMIEIGFYSLPVVGLTMLFTGMVLALQSHSGFSVGGEGTIATVVIWGITRELGPVLAGLMVAGRIGAAMAAEIGTMRVTEQIDALTTMSADPFKYLVAPRLIAGLLMLPLLVAIGDVIGVLGGWLAAIYQLGFNPSTYLKSSWDAFEMRGFVSGMVKATAFGFLVALMGCYHGYNSKGGAKGVGQATTNAVVSASILILLFNYIITTLFFGF